MPWSSQPGIAFAGHLRGDFDCLAGKFEPPALRVGRLRAHVQNRRRTDHRVSGEGQFFEEIEDPGCDGARLVGGLEEDGFEVPQSPG